MLGKFENTFYLNVFLEFMNMNFILLGAIGPNEIIIILVVVLLLFGGKKIPELMRGLGKGMKEFKDATKGIEDDIKSVDPTKELKK